MYHEEELRYISKQFQIYGEIVHAELCKIGHINETYTASYNQGGVQVRYVHQKLNKNVFRKPTEVMSNLERVTRHIRSVLEQEHAVDITRRSLTLIPTRDGKSFYKDRDGNYWRTFVFIEGVRTFEKIEKPSQAYEAGYAFGDFQKQLTDLPGERLHETIPNFHNTRKRFNDFIEALNRDVKNRAQYAKDEIKFAMSQEKIVDIVINSLKKKTIPERITHNDTKFNNLMLDTLTSKGLCVVDLDTVMPGCILYDFGDMVRTTTSPSLEDETDLDKVEMQFPIFKELSRGYLTATKSFLTAKEKSLLAFSGKLISLTIGLRFLTDYLNGDTYFRVHRPNHNLDRARTQFKLVRSIEKQEKVMQKFIDSL